MNHILGCNQFTRESLNEILDLAEKIKKNPKKYKNSLRDKIIAVMFFEPSTRTRMSFESAILKLGGKMIVTENGKSNSSSTKGETIEDSVKVINGYADAIIMRHSCDESAEIAASVSTIPVINAGSGKKEHPTQSLLDVISTNKASYFLLKTSNSPLPLKCVQLNDKVYLLWAKLNFCLNSAIAVSPFSNTPVTIFS